MRQFITAAAMALGLIAVWAAILPLTAQPSPKPAVAGAPPMSKALFLCRGANGIDSACAAALAKALVIDATQGAPRETATDANATNANATNVNDRTCKADPQVLASLDRRG